ncbi:hypothetical protein BD408DRAFT_414625 [Parasitella parasitica]|nr:hypothetical protein BD408DRAFT_414625 [Parasitella parasitica]
MGKQYSDKICCCIPTRLGVLLMSTIIFSIYLVLTVLMFFYKQDLQKWSTLQSNVDAPLTIEAFNGLFHAFSIIFIVYSVVSIMGIISIAVQHRRMVRIYHVANWFFVLLLLTVTVAFWIYFKVKQDSYVNDCQTLRNIQNNSTSDPFYKSIQIPGKQIVAGGSDKSECIQFIRRLVIASGVLTFVCNIIQLYWARSIGVYATSLKRHYQHRRLQVHDDDDLISTRSV